VAGLTAKYQNRSTMRALKAQVRGGRLVLDEPTDLPEGTEVELVASDHVDLDPEERARLDAAWSGAWRRRAPGKSSTATRS
jgi:hypothetical protein